MKKLNNKGFSLVELIIVIAIMAILVGVVGTQVIPYLENSRQAKDYQVLSSWNTSAMSAYSSAAAKIDSTKDYTIVITPAAGSTSVTYSDGTTTSANPSATSNPDLAAIKKYFEDLTNITTFKKTDFESKTGKSTLSSVTITIDHNTGYITLVSDPASAFDPIESK